MIGVPNREYRAFQREGTVRYESRDARTGVPVRQYYVLRRGTVWPTAGEANDEQRGGGGGGSSETTRYDQSAT